MRQMTSARKTATAQAASARAVLFALILAACAQPPASSAQTAAAPDGSLFAAAPAQQWRLPAELREISGLAATADGRVFAHDDEQAILYQLDLAHGRIAKRFALGNNIVRGDFEGLAITPDGDYYMITATGLLHRFREGADGAHVPFETLESGLRDTCEVEGLAFLQAENSLIIACKRNNDRAMRDTVSLYAFPLGQSQATARAWVSVSSAALSERAGVSRFQPSSVEIDPASGRILVLSGNRGAFAELARDGTILAARALAGHPQAEGATILRDGSLLISDEGANGQALLSRYDRAP